jgi:hypothetical protein
MKKLPISCAVVVLLAWPACQVDATIIALTNGTGTPGILNSMETLFPNRDLFTRNEILGALYIRDNNDVTLSNILGATPYGLTSDSGELSKYNPLIDVNVLLINAERFTGNDTQDTVDVHDNNDLILPTRPAAMPGGLILEYMGYPEYNPMPDVTMLFSDKDLFVESDIEILFFNGDFFTGNQLIDIVYIPGKDNIIPSVAPYAALDGRLLEKSSPLEYYPGTNITSSYLQRSISGNIDTLYTTEDTYVIPEPEPITILCLGSLFLLIKRKARPGQPYRIAPNRMK